MKRNDDKKPKQHVFACLKRFNKAGGLRDLAQTEAKLLLACLDYADFYTREVRVKLETFADDIRSKKPHVSEAFQGLVARGAIAEVTKGGGRGKLTTYKLFPNDDATNVTSGRNVSVDESTDDTKGNVTSNGAKGYGKPRETLRINEEKVTPDFTEVVAGKGSSNRTTHSTPVCTTHPTRQRVGESSANASTSKDIETRSDRKRNRLGKDDKSPTGKTLSDTEVDLMGATGLSQKKGETRKAWLARLANAGGKLFSTKFDALPLLARNWIEACESGNDIADPLTVEAKARESARLDQEDREARKDASAADRKKSILAGFRHFDVTHLALKLYTKYGPYWCEQVLMTCERTETAHGWQRASWECKHFAKEPETFDMPRKERKEDDEYDDDHCDEEDAQRGDDEDDGYGDEE